MAQFPHLELGVMTGSLPGWLGLSESACMQPGTAVPGAVVAVKVGEGGAPAASLIQASPFISTWHTDWRELLPPAPGPCPLTAAAICSPSPEDPFKTNSKHYVL